MKPVFLALFSVWTVAATDITTGSMLGRGFDQRAFYIRATPFGTWQKTYSGNDYRFEAQGKLMNLRVAQAVSHDEWLTGLPFDPEANTNAVIAALDFYKSHGVLMIGVSLQGGAAIYEPGPPAADRKNGYRFGRLKGTNVSAFEADGSLKPAWLLRLERLLRAADLRGMIVNLIYFDAAQDELFQSTQSIHAAARNITGWLIAGRFRNVIVDIANEYDLGGDRWDFRGYIPQNIIQLIDEVRARFDRAGYALPIGVSSDGRMRFPESLAGQVDVVLLHGNNRSPEMKARRAEEMKNLPRPVVMNQDDNGHASTKANLAQDLGSCDIFFHQAEGWGYVPPILAQRFPFQYMPDSGAEVRDEMPQKERDLAYFHAVLDHIASLTLRRPPQD